MHPTLKYAHASPDYLQTVVRKGSLGMDMLKPVPTVAKSVATGWEEGAGSVQPVENLVRPEGLEPPTPRSVVWCSIH